MMPGTSAGSPWLSGKDFCRLRFRLLSRLRRGDFSSIRRGTAIGPLLLLAAGGSQHICNAHTSGVRLFFFWCGGASFLASFAAGLAGAVPPPRAAARMSAVLMLPASAFFSFGAGVHLSWHLSRLAWLVRSLHHEPLPECPRCSCFRRPPFFLLVRGRIFLGIFCGRLGRRGPSTASGSQNVRGAHASGVRLFFLRCGGASFLASFAAGLAGAAPPPRAAARMSAVLMLPASAFFSFGAGAHLSWHLLRPAWLARPLHRERQPECPRCSCFRRPPFFLLVQGRIFLASFAAGLAGAAPPPRAAARMSAVLIAWSASEVAGFFFEATSAFGVDFLLGETEGAASVPPSRFSSTTEVSAVVLAGGFLACGSRRGIDRRNSRLGRGRRFWCLRLFRGCRSPRELGFFLG